MLVYNSKSLCRHLLCDVIEMEDLTPAGETSSLYPYGALSTGDHTYITSTYFILLEFYDPIYPKNSRKKAGYSYRDKSMTTNYTAITCQLKADMKKVYVDLININLY